MNFKIIVAATKKFGIGLNNKLPWRIPEDLKHFSKTTIGKGNNAIIMGRKTWESIGSKPLPKRHNIIISTTIDKPKYDNVSVFPDPNEAFEYCRFGSFDETWIIGGEKIYAHFMDPHYIAYRRKITDCLVTVVPGEYECDTYFPMNECWSLHKTTKIENTDLEIRNYKPFIA